MLINFSITLVRNHKYCKSLTWQLLAQEYSSSSSSLSATFISSAANEKVKLIRALKLKKKRDDLGLVLVEGYRLLQDAIECGIQPQQIFLTEASAATVQGKALLSFLKRSKQIGFVSYVTSSIYESIAETVTSQGVIAACSKPYNLSHNQLTDNPTAAPLIVLLDKLADPGNVGTMIRSSYGLGASVLLSVESCDVWSPKVLRSSMGACFRLPMHEIKWPQVMNTITSVQQEFSGISHEQCAQYQVVIADGDGSNGLSYSAVDFTRPTVLVIGSEASGVSKQASELPGDVRRAKIPMLRPLESFNAAVAGSIMLAEAARQRQQQR